MHREYHDEQNMKRIHNTAAYKVVNNVRVGKAQEFERESKVPYRVPLDRQSMKGGRPPLDNHGRMCKLSAVGSTLSQETIDMYMQQERSQRNLGLSPGGRVINYRLPWRENQKKTAGGDDGLSIADQMDVVHGIWIKCVKTYKREAANRTPRPYSPEQPASKPPRRSRPSARTTRRASAASTNSQPARSTRSLQRSYLTS